MPLPVVAWFIAKAIMTYWGLRVKLVRLFQERLSEIGMGRFIAEYSRDGWVKQYHEQIIRSIINAYILFLTPCCLLAVYGKEIRSNEYLHNYFLQWESYALWCSQKDALGDKTVPVSNEPSMIGDLFKVYGMPEHTSRLQECIGNRPKVGELVVTSIMDAVSKLKDQTDKAILYINQKVKTYEFTPYLGLLPAWFWRGIHPTLDLDWAVIKSYIVLYKAYQEIHYYDELRELVPAFIKDQMVRVEVDEKPFTYLPVDADGKLAVEIPRSLLTRKLALNSFGLTYEIAPWKICSFVPTKPQDIYLLGGGQWGRVKELLKNRTMLVVPCFVGGLASEEMQELLETYLLKVNLVINTEPWNAFDPKTFKDIFYKASTKWAISLIRNNIIIDCVEQGFQNNYIWHSFDYQMGGDIRLEDVVHYTGDSWLTGIGWAYRKVGESFIIETPYDGIWKDLATLDTWMSWIPCERVIWMAGYTTDLPEHHEYPSVHATFQAYASKWGIPLYVG